MANPYTYKVNIIRRKDKESCEINSCRSLAKFLAYHLGLADGQIGVTKGINNVYIYFAKQDRLHTIVWDCMYASWSERAAQEIVEFIKNVP